MIKSSVIGPSLWKILKLVINNDRQCPNLTQSSMKIHLKVFITLKCVFVFQLNGKIHVNLEALRVICNLYMEQNFELYNLPWPNTFCILLIITVEQHIAFGAGYVACMFSLCSWNLRNSVHDFMRREEYFCTRGK